MDVLSSLGINLTNFLWHTANFILLIFLLSRVLYKPIVGILDERQQRVRESMERAEQVRLEAERTQQEREEQLVEARRQIREMLDQATQTAERIQADARERADQDARRIVERAQQEAAAERTQAMADLRREVAGLAVMAAERVISRNLDEQGQRQLINEFLAEQPATDGRTT